MAVLNTIITSSPHEILTFRQASEDIGIQYEYLYNLEKQDKFDITYPFPHGKGPMTGQKFIVVNSKYHEFKDRWYLIHRENPDWNKKTKKKKGRKK